MHPIVVKKHINTKSNGSVLDGLNCEMIEAKVISALHIPGV